MASEIIRRPTGLARLTQLHEELCEVNGNRTPQPDPPCPAVAGQGVQ